MGSRANRFSDGLSERLFLSPALTMAMCLVFMSVLACSLMRGRDERGKPGGKTAEEYVLFLKDRLKLTAEQEKQIRPIINEEREKRREILESYIGERESMRDAMRWLEKNTESQLAAILTPEQMQKYWKLQDEMQQGGEERTPGHRGGRL
jgi:Spy/CpxP family protein refolding chaperone